MFEEGMPIDLKKMLLDTVNESRKSAQQEEQRRQNRQQQEQDFLRETLAKPGDIPKVWNICTVYSCRYSNQIICMLLSLDMKCRSCSNIKSK